MQQQQQQKRRSPSPMSLQPLFRQQHQQRQQQQHYSIPTLVIQPGNRTSGGSQQRPHYTSADSLVSNEFQPIDMSIDEYIIQNDRQGDGNTTHAVASVAATLESTSVVDDITYPVADASAINEEDTEEANNVDYGTQHDNDNAWSSRHSGNESARLAASNHSISEVDNMANVYPTSGSNAPSVVVLGNSSSLPLSATIHGSPIGQQRVILSSTHDNRQSLRQQADRNRPEIEINFEEDDISFLQGGGNDANIMSSACGWTEVMTSSTNSRVGTGRVHGVGGMIGAGLPAINHHSTTMPSPRSLHSAALLNGVMYIFGGYDGTQRVNSFHAYTFADKRWSPVCKYR
jgi:Kelch motif